MMTSSFSGSARRKAAVRMVLVFGLILAAALAVLPDAAVQPAKSLTAAALMPGQSIVAKFCAAATDVVVYASGAWTAAARVRQQQRELAQLCSMNRRLEADLAQLRRDSAWHDADASHQSLLIAGVVEAQVLGQQARSYLVDRGLLAAGVADGVVRDALVVDGPMATIDRGRDARLGTGHVVLAGSHVWGKIAEVGRWTSTVRRPTEPGYRDVVQLSPPDGLPRHDGPRGMLEGTGDALCRVRLVSATEPVSVGDRVYAAGGDGVIDDPLLYGEVVRAELPVGAAHWEVWVRPAGSGTRPRHVGVVRIELNRLRIAADGAVQRR